MLLSKLLSLLLYRLVGIAAPFGMLFSLSSCAITAAVFGVIFLLTLAFNLLQIHLARPVELLRSGKAGERQPRTRWLLTLIGLAAMIQHALVIPCYINITWELTHVNDYSRIYAPYGTQNERFVNWETSVDGYTTEDYAAFEAAYNK